MKKYKIFILLTIIILCSGCQTNNELNRSALRISNKIIEKMQSDEVKLSKMSKDEKKIYKEFVKSQEEENYIINLDNINLYEINDLYKASPNSDRYVYSDNGINKIKYTDIDWLSTDVLEYTTIVIDGERRILYKYQVPLFSVETKDSPRYRYIYEFSNDFGNYIEFYYRSLARDESFAQTTGAIVRVHKNNHKLGEIELIYDEEHNPKKIETKNYAQTILKVVISIFIGVVFVAGALKLMRKV